eukprot:1184675-Prorocentrum_minimum.AAC.2
MLLCEYSPRGGAVAGMLGRAGTEECGICELVRRGLGLTREESIDFGLREGAVLLYRPVRISLNPCISSPKQVSALARHPLPLGSHRAHRVPSSGPFRSFVQKYQRRIPASTCVISPEEYHTLSRLHLIGLLVVELSTHRLRCSSRSVAYNLRVFNDGLKGYVTEGLR